MLRKRVIAVLPIKAGIVVQSIGFERYLPVGAPGIAAEFLNHWGVDEIVLLDLDATPEGRAISPEAVLATVERCAAPLTAGGGIRSADDIRRVIQSGADKIAINTAAFEDPDLIARAASSFGEQCVVVCLDVRSTASGYEVFTHGGRRPTGMDPQTLARRAQERGAGEIIVQSIDRDGSRSGYDLRLARLMSEAVRVPLVVLGGAGHPRHMVEAFAAADLSGVAAGNMLHFTEHSVTTIKSYLGSAGVSTRLDTYADYRGRAFGDDGRIAKRRDEDLAEMAFEHVPVEVI